MSRRLFAGSMLAVAGFDCVHVLRSMVHDAPFCPAELWSPTLGGWRCGSFLAVSMYFGLVQVCVLALSLALVAVVRARLYWGAVVGTVVALSMLVVMWGLSKEALDTAGVETAETLIGSTRQVVGMNSALAIMLVAVWVAGMHAIRLRRRGRGQLAEAA